VRCRKWEEAVGAKKSTASHSPSTWTQHRPEPLQVREPSRELNADELAVVTGGTLKPYPAPPIPIPYPNAF
jgi:hypothetical protein